MADGHARTGRHDVGTVVVHGGCDDLPVETTTKERRRDGVRRACEAGYAALVAGGSAVDAVEAAIRILEDDPIFDAGTGSFMNLLGDIEMDALIATSDGRAGGVAAIGDVRYPISVARAVMERTPHVLLVGAGATAFARAIGVPHHDPAAPEARRLHERQLADLEPSLAAMLPQYAAVREGLKSTSTVGAIVRDGAGVIAAGTSTGGIPQKLPGRVGDSAILGAGTFAAPAGGASTSGQGETIMRLGVTRRIVDAVAAGVDAQRACEEAIGRCTDARSPCGVAFLGGDGAVVTVHNGTFMPVFVRGADDAEARTVELEVERAAYGP